MQDLHKYSPLLTHTVVLLTIYVWSTFYARHTIQVRPDFCYDSLGCVSAASASMTHIQGTSFFPVLGEGGAHVTLQPLDRPDHQVIH